MQMPRKWTPDVRLLIIQQEWINVSNRNKQAWISEMDNPSNEDTSIIIIGRTIELGFLRSTSGVTFSAGKIITVENFADFIQSLNRT